MDLLLALGAILVAPCTGPYCGPDVAFERPADGVFGEATAPALALAEDGTLCVAWESKAGGERDVYFNRREPGAGGRWGVPVRLDTDEPGAARSIEVRLVAGSERRVYAVWQDAREGPDAIRFRRSLDGGTTWSGTDVRITPAAASSFTQSMASLAADGTGRVYLAWEDLRHGERDVYFRRSTDHGETWGPEQRIDSDSPGRAPSYHPQIAAWAEGTVVVVWWDERDGASDLYARRSVDGGVSWPEPEARIDEGPAGESVSHDARLSTSGDRLAVSWEEGSDRPNATIVLRASEDRGATWEAPVVYGAGDDAVPYVRARGSTSVAWVSRDERARVEKTSIGGRIIEIGPSVLLHASHGKKPGDVPSTRGISRMEGPSSVWMGGIGEATTYVARTGASGGRGIVEIFESRAPWAGAAAEDWRRLSIVPFGGELLFTDADVRAHSLLGAVAADRSVHLVWVAELAGFGSLGYARVEPALPSVSPEG